MESVLNEKFAAKLADENGRQAYGVWYQDLSERTGGIVGSVCEDDYGAQLAAMGSTTSSLISSVQLDCAPVDADGDGRLDVSVLLQQTGQMLTGYTVSGRSLQFSQSLPVGTVQISYNCAK